MNREIKFRGKSINQNMWLYGHLFQWGLTKGVLCVCCCVPNSYRDVYNIYAVNPETIGQYTGLKDKNGTEIYEGDIIEYYETYNYCINPDCEPCIQGYGLGLCKKTAEVQFVDGVFGVEKSEYSLTPLIYCGIREEDISDIKEYAENSAYFDANGYNVDGSIVGIEVIGNIHDNPELLQ